MPTIRPYTPQVGANADIPSRQAAASDFGNPGLTALGVGTQRAGQDLAQTLAIQNADAYHAQQRIDQQKRQASHLAIQSLAVQAMHTAQTELAARQKSAPPGAPGFTEQTKEAERLRAEHLADQAQAPGEDGTPSVIRSEDIPYLQLELQRNTSHILTAAGHFEAQALAAHTKAQYQSTLELQRNIVQANPALLDSEAQRAFERVHGIEAWTEQQKREQVVASRQYLAGGAIDGTIDALVPTTNLAAIQALRQDLTREASPWKVQLDPKDYAHALDRLTALENHVKEKRSLVAMDALKEQMREARTGVVNGLSLQSVDAVEPDPERAVLLKKEVASALVTGEAVRMTQSASHEERMALYQQSLTALAAPGRFDQDADKHRAIVQVIQEQVNAWKQDPATMALRAEPVKAAYDAMAAHGTPEAVDAYVKATRAEQHRQAPWQPPRLLSADQVGQLKAVMAAIPNGPDGADHAFKAIGTEYQRWGHHWPDVYRQLAQEKALTDTQIAAARMVMDPLKHADMRLLLATSAMKPNDLEALLPKGTDIRMTEAIQSEMKPVQAALALQVGGIQELDRQSQAVRSLALGYMLRDQSLTEQKAAERAAAVVVKSDFHWEGSYFVPRAYDPKQIKAGTEMILRNMGDAVSQWPVVPPADLSGMKPSDNKAAMIDALRTGGQWVTNADGSGLTLTWPNAAREAVRLQNGATFTLTWDQLKDVGVPTQDWFGRKLK